MRDPYQDLGVEKNASAEDIKKAYKAKVKKTHPDKTGGSREEFDKVQSAYLVLKDPETREHYDKHGEQKEKKTEKHLNLIAGLFEQLLQRDDLPYNFDYVKTIKASLGEMISKVDVKSKDLEKDITKFEKLKNKFKRKPRKNVKVEKEPNNFFKMAIEAKIKMAKDNLKSGEEFRDQIKRAMEVIDDYEYEVDKTPPPPMDGDDAAEAFRYFFRGLGRTPPT